jgi:hypothetical protein
LSTLDRWLADGDAPEADWGGHVTRLANQGGLGDGGPRLLLDLPALAQPHACRTAACTPGLREAGQRSCCADLDVAPSADERAALAAAADELAAFYAPRDPRWAAGPPATLDDGVLTRPGRRCVFALRGAEGLSCGLHTLEDASGRPRGALKPLACRLFPLAVVDMGSARLLTAVHKRTARALGSQPARRFPCLKADAGLPSVAETERALIAELFGERAARRILAAVVAWGAR